MKLLDRSSAISANQYSFSKFKQCQSRELLNLVEKETNPEPVVKPKEVVEWASSQPCVIVDYPVYESANQVILSDTQQTELKPISTLNKTRTLDARKSLDLAHDSFASDKNSVNAKSTKVKMKDPLAE